MNWAVVATVVALVVGMIWATACRRSPERAHGHVETTFVATDGTTIAHSTLPLDQLPDSFLLDTTLEMDGKSWSVAKAEPASKPEFAASGKVTVTLVPITSMDPKDILFSLPTIANDTGSVKGDALPTEAFHLLGEDDWRQAEFVSARFKAQLAEELADIRSVRSEHAVGIGYDQIHVRKRIPDPLRGSKVQIPAIRKLLRVEKELEGVAFSGVQGSVPGGFAWQTGGLVVWGVANDQGDVSVLCVSLPPGAVDSAIGETIGPLTAAFGLIFVDWIGAKTVPALNQ